MAPAHPTHKFKLLLRREFWEHRGGFFWAPVIAGGISLLLTLMAIIVGLVAANRAAEAGTLELDGVNVSGLDLGQLTQQMSPQDMAEFADGINLSLFLGSGWPFIVLAFVVFFYCLGALYDERKDRSVLFWKSLPLSDAQTVLSKVASAVLVAPAIAVAVAVVTMFAFMVLISAVVVLHGGNAWTLIWEPASPLSIVAGHIAWIPVYALWALPTVGWLLLCSVWARSAPFLWAVMVPVFAGVFVSWFKLMDVFNMDASWFWTHIVGRLLLGTVPAIDQIYRDDLAESMSNNGLENIVGDLSFSHQIASLAMPELWIGAIAGAVMILGAIRLRRWRDEG
ncbi:membrane protein [Lysobacter arseniciresistens ZS79]|uniref:Membrane protein n=1 Tax=Lysobacter arseniciresistens ZS79 TaxID=913325 RepID=A0A0A0F4I8_9GAMM|nr:membrane protein [Lysobacter arseniciresistens ZS79]